MDKLNPRERIIAAVTATGLGAALLLGACSSEAETPQTEVLSVTTSALESADITATSCEEQITENPQYKLAADATWAALHSNDFATAEQLVQDIESPTLKEQALSAIDEARGEYVVWEAWKNDDFVVAQEVYADIDDPVVQQVAGAGLGQAQSEFTLWGATPRDTSAWYDHNAATSSMWYSLKTMATSSWYDLHKQAITVSCEPIIDEQ